MWESLLRGVMALVLVFALAACAGSPESKLKRGYDTVGASARATTVLVQRKMIDKEGASHVLTLSDTALATLNDGKEKLKACRAAEAAGQKVQCELAVSTINLGSGVLLQLEQYLEAMQKAGGQ